MSILVLTTNPANPKLDEELVRAIHAEIGGTVNQAIHMYLRPALH